ncbi:hypothetical protein ACFLTH_17280 [Bacteroidota bacterium]
MGAIVYWTLIRIVILIPALWYLLDWVAFKYSWLFIAAAVYIVVIHPAVIQYKKFMDQNEEIVNNSLCSTCKHFDKSAVVCMMYDKHPIAESIPCEGNAWEPAGTDE